MMVNEPFKTKPVTPSTWPDLEVLFESKGGPAYCWCMPFREIENRTTAGRADRKAALKSRVERRTPIGLVGYLGGEAVAWCSVGPRDTFARLSPDQDDTEDAVWSITCFFVRRQHRKTGLSSRMLAEAVKFTRKRGAKIVEAYPVDASSPSYRHMGFLSLYETAGFRIVGRAGSRRYVVRKAL